jgi:hypothetical protein
VIAALSGIPTNVTSVRYYLLPVSAASSTGGFVGNLTPVGGVTSTLTLSSGGNGTLNVAINSDTGEIIFPVAPVVGTLSATYQSIRYSDTQILDALKEGLQAMWPEIWQEQIDTSLTPTPYAYEYTLPTVFNDPRVEILKVEIRDPNVIVVPYRKVFRYTRVSQQILALTDLLYSPAGNIRLHYNAPYGALSDTEPQVMHLPVYFALGRLLADQEAMRSRQDELVPLTGEGGSQSGVAQQTSSYWFALYEREKRRFAREVPSGATRVFDDWSYSIHQPYSTTAGRK